MPGVGAGAPVRWMSRGLNPGLSVDPHTGHLQGTPTVAGVTVYGTIRLARSRAEVVWLWLWGYR